MEKREKVKNREKILQVLKNKTIPLGDTAIARYAQMPVSRVNEELAKLVSSKKVIAFDYWIVAPIPKHIVLYRIKRDHV